MVFSNVMTITGEIILLIDFEFIRNYKILFVMQLLIYLKCSSIHKCALLGTRLNFSKLQQNVLLCWVQHILDYINIVSPLHSTLDFLIMRLRKRALRTF